MFHPVSLREQQFGLAGTRRGYQNPALVLVFSERVFDEAKPERFDVKLDCLVLILHDYGHVAN